MKKIYFSLFLVTLAVTSFAQTFYVYTAQTSGLWTESSNWITTERTDGVQKNKVVIPVNINITADNDVDNLGLGDVQVVVYGTLTVSPGTNLNFSYNSSFELSGGTIHGLLANQKIKIGSDIKYRGDDDGILTGHFFADNTTNGFQSLSILPVHFTSFYVSKSGQNIQLTWSTDNEINNSHFDVERSFNGLEWNKIATIKGAGNSSNANNYSYNDKNVSGSVIYYRLRQVDIDGRSVYSSIKTIRANEAISPVKIYASERNVVIDLNQAIKNDLVVSVVNINGQVISRKTFNNPQYKISFNLENVTAGAFVVQVTDNKGWTVVKKVVL